MIRAVQLQRLTRSADFKRVRAGRRHCATPGFVLQARTRSGDAEEEARLGFTVSKRVGNAVMRNRARRRLREAARLVLAEAAMPGVDYVLIGRGDAITRPFERLQADMVTALSRLSLLRRDAGETPR
jgi:ribonuclease P protein component